MWKKDKRTGRRKTVSSWKKQSNFDRDAPTWRGYKKGAIKKGWHITEVWLRGHESSRLNWKT